MKSLPAPIDVEKLVQVVEGAEDRTKQQLSMNEDDRIIHNNPAKKTRSNLRPLHHKKTKLQRPPPKTRILSRNLPAASRRKPSHPWQNNSFRSVQPSRRTRGNSQSNQAQHQPQEPKPVRIQRNQTPSTLQNNEHGLFQTQPNEKGKLHFHRYLVLH